VNPALHIAVAGALVLVTLAVLVWVIVAYRLDLRAEQEDDTVSNRVIPADDQDTREAIADWVHELRDDAA